MTCQLSRLAAGATAAAVLTLGGLFAVAGCTSFSDATSTMRDRLAGRDEGRTRTYAALQRTTYQAVRLAAERMGYRVTRGGAAQGYLEAVSGIGAGEIGRSSRQITMHVTLKPSLDDGTEVTVRLTEITESEGVNRSAVATQTPLQGTPQYEVFFRAVQQALDQEAAGK